MPLERRTTATEGTQYGHPFIDGPRDVEQILIDLSDLAFADASGGEVDADGYLIPGTPIQTANTTGTAGTLVDGAGQKAGIVISPVYIGATPIAADTDLDTVTDIQVAVARGGLINRDICEDNMVRAFTANELAALELGGIQVSAT